MTSALQCIVKTRKDVDDLDGFEIAKVANSPEWYGNYKRLAIYKENGEISFSEVNTAIQTRNECKIDGVRSVEIFAKKISLDQDLKLPGKNLALVAEEWNVNAGGKPFLERRITLDGENVKIDQATPEQIGALHALCSNYDPGVYGKVRPWDECHKIYPVADGSGNDKCKDVQLQWEIYKQHKANEYKNQVSNLFSHIANFYAKFNIKANFIGITPEQVGALHALCSNYDPGVYGKARPLDECHKIYPVADGSDNDKCKDVHLQWEVYKQHKPNEYETEIGKLVPFINNFLFPLSKASSGTYAGASGTDGLPGRPGGNAGNFYGVGNGKKSTNLDKLTISANGGNGGKGQDGGDGQNGYNGSDAVCNSNIGAWCDKKEINEGGFVSGHNFYCKYGSSGSSGGSAGKGGCGGIAGIAGKIEIKELIKGIYSAPKSLINNGSKGMDGNSGTAGSAGLGGCAVKDAYHIAYQKEGVATILGGIFTFGMINAAMGAISLDLNGKWHYCTTDCSRRASGGSTGLVSQEKSTHVQLESQKIPSICHSLVKSQYSQIESAFWMDTTTECNYELNMGISGYHSEL